MSCGYMNKFSRFSATFLFKLSFIIVSSNVPSLAFKSQIIHVTPLFANNSRSDSRHSNKSQS